MLGISHLKFLSDDRMIKNLLPTLYYLWTFFLISVRMLFHQEDFKTASNAVQIASLVGTLHMSPVHEDNAETIAYLWRFPVFLSGLGFSIRFKLDTSILWWCTCQLKQSGEGETKLSTSILTDVIKISTFPLFWNFNIFFGNKFQKKIYSLSFTNVLPRICIATFMKVMFSFYIIHVSSPGLKLAFCSPKGNKLMLLLLLNCGR